MAKVGLYAIGTSTTLESNKSQADNGTRRRSGICGPLSRYGLSPVTLYEEEYGAPRTVTLTALCA